MRGWARKQGGGHGQGDDEDIPDCENRQDLRRVQDGDDENNHLAGHGGNHNIGGVQLLHAAGDGEEECPDDQAFALPG